MKREKLNDLYMALSEEIGSSSMDIVHKIVKAELELKDKHIKDRLTYLKKQIEQENISYLEVAELQSLKDHIDKNDKVLLQWAGVEEFEVLDNALDYYAEVLRNLVTAIEANIVQIDNNPHIPLRYIVDELEEAKKTLNN